MRTLSHGESTGATLDLLDRTAALDRENARLRELICELLRKNEMLRARLSASALQP